MNIIRHIVRFIVSALVLLVVSWIVPRFSVGGFFSALLLALFIAVVGWIAESMFGRRISPFGRGIIGFIVSALVIWAAQFIIGGVRASLIGAVLAALVIGIIDLFIPAAPFDSQNRTRGRA
jgi:putative membrane protein